jgi:sugar phosphate isomerase/epimerase
MNGNNGFFTIDEIKSRLSISTLVFWNYQPLSEKSLAELARHGFTRIELLESPEQFDMADTRSMRFIAEACRANGIQIAAYHAHKTHFSDLDSETARQARVDQCRQQIDTMLELGGTVWGSHALQTDNTLLRCYEELARHIEGTEAIITLENFKLKAFWIEERVAFLDKINHPQVGMILDIGHVRNQTGENPMTLPGGPTQVLDMCGNHVHHVHLHGFKDGIDHFPPLVEGDTIQWYELFNKLHAIGYMGYINFEPKGESFHQNTIEITARAPRRIVDLVQGT